MIDGRRVVQSFEAIMNAREGHRDSHLETLRHLPLATRDARRARDACVRMFDAVALASTIQNQLEPMADQLSALADAGVPVPAEQRESVVRLYHQATLAVDRASAEQRPCVESIDRLRAHAVRRR